jgi:hypothetical protein
MVRTILTHAANMHALQAKGKGKGKKTSSQQTDTRTCLVQQSMESQSPQSGVWLAVVA